jgi:hypothetical protein
MDSLSINAKLVWFPCLKELTLPCKGVTPDQLDKFDVTKRYGMLAICDYVLMLDPANLLELK